MEVDQILSRIRNEWQREMDNSSLIRDLMNKISQGKATYADAQDVAIKAGDALSDLFRRYLPEALVDGRLPEEIADKLIRQPLMDTYKLASSQAADVQRSLNQAADIGIDAVVPDPNVDQIDGIIHGISTARDYHHYEESFLDQVENFPEGVVDDTVRANADFQYHAGLSPTIERKTDGKCCPWCSRLAGTYPYEDVRNAGNDVFRRHRNCHCQVLFNPGDGSKRRQNVHSRQWTDSDRDELRERRIHYGQKETFESDNGEIRARKVNNYHENNLYVDQNVTIAPKEIRRINEQITAAKELHGLTRKCDAPFVIINDADRLAAYNPRTNTFYVSSRLADARNIVKLQTGYACPSDQRSTMVHELFHWKDAEDYRKTVGPIISATRTSPYSIYQREKAGRELIKAGYSGEEMEKIKQISKYAVEKQIDNDLEEVYTELRTKQLIERGQ